MTVWLVTQSDGAGTGERIVGIAGTRTGGQRLAESDAGRDMVWAQPALSTSVKSGRYRVTEWGVQ